ncbi:MAG: poly-beta-1,6 N-acetyl-D-glucosamine export porin PgaA [Betaproteobacteria bacterium]
MQRLQRLKEQADRNPGNKPFLYDYMQALEEAHRSVELLALLPRVDLAATPPAVLARLGRAANEQKRFAVAADIFRAALRQAPDRSEVLAGLAYALIDDGKPDGAVELLESRRAAVWRQVPLLEAYAEALRAQREYAQALLLHDRILALEPGNREAQRNRIFAVARAGAPHRALELAQASPGLLSVEETLALRSDRAAVTTRWGAAADADAPGRFVATDAALAQNVELLQLAQASGQAASPALRRLQFDRIVLLRNRVRMQEAADLHDALESEGVDIAPYAQVAAADAFLYLHRPERARDLFLRAQARGENEFGGQVGLFYAYSDAEQHAAAIAQIDKVVEATPQKINAYSPLTVSDNPDYASAVATAAAARAYQDRLDDAQRRLEAFRDQAPWNMEAREKLAAVYGARGWPRRAEQEQLWILAAEPRDRAARIAYADTLRELQEWEAARREAATLEQEYPEDRQVQRVARLWRIHQMRELQVEAGTGDASGGGGPLGSREHQIETHLYSAPIDRDWRAFIHQFEARASFPDGSGFRRRIGAGAELRFRDWRGSAEINQSYDDESNVGLSLQGGWWASDQWNFDAAVDTSSNDIPLQARSTGVRGWSLRAGATYRASESRSFRAGVQTIEFNDGNRREIASGSATQRFISGPVYKLDGVLGLYASRNSLAGAAYFNPESDFGADVTLIGEQRLWRRYERSFVHRLYVSLGQYQQKSFGSGPTRGIRYEHEWNADDRLSLLYGAQRTLHPYDGRGEYANYYNVAVNWKF